MLCAFALAPFLFLVAPTPSEQRNHFSTTAMGSSAAQSSWDGFAVEYELRVEPFTSKFANEMLLHADHFEIDDSPVTSSKTKRKRLLDVGCGTGALSILALSQGYDVVAADSSALMVQRAKGRAKDRDFLESEFSCVVSDGQTLPLDWSSSFDVAMANFSVIFFPDPVSGLKEMYRCLVPCGVAAFTAWGDPSQTAAFRVFPDVAAEIVPDLASRGRPKRITGSVDTLTKLMVEAGFVDVWVVGPVVKTLEVASPEAYYDRFALTSPPTAAMIEAMDPRMRNMFRQRVMEVATARGGKDDGSIGLDSSAYIAYGRRPSDS